MSEVLHVRYLHPSCALAILILMTGCADARDDRPAVKATGVQARAPVKIATPPAEFPVGYDGGKVGVSEVEVEFPRANVETAPRIVEDDGGYLDLARSPDGRVLWVRREWDEPSTDVHRFTMESPPDPRFILQFVDGVVDTSTVAAAYADDEVFAADSVSRDDGLRFDRVLQAWVIDRSTHRARRPNSGEWYPLVAAPNTQRTVTPDRLQWMVFVSRCSEVSSGCVYYGAPEDVCGRYFDQTSRETGALWIAPARRCGTHW
jgi:hypothetical protein